MRSCEESLQDLDDIELPGCRKPTPLSVIHKKRDRETGLYERRERKNYPRRRKEKPAPQRNEGLYIILKVPSEVNLEKEV